MRIRWRHVIWSSVALLAVALAGLAFVLLLQRPLESARALEIEVGASLSDVSQIMGRPADKIGRRPNGSVATQVWTDDGIRDSKRPHGWAGVIFDEEERVERVDCFPLKESLLNKLRRLLRI